MRHHLLLAALVSALRADYCYDQQCSNYDGSTISCDQEYYSCTEGSYWDPSATCWYSGYGDTWNSVWCYSDDSCQHDWWTGEASCSDDDIDDLVDAGLSIIYTIIIACVAGVVGLVILCCCCCYCVGKGCCKKSSNNQVQVIQNQPGVVYPAQQPQYNPQPPPQYHPQPAPQFSQQGPQPVPAQMGYNMNAYPPPQPKH